MEPTDSLTNNSSSNNIHWKIEQFVYEKENNYDDDDDGHHNDHDDHKDWSDHDGPHPGSGAPVLLGSRPHSKRAGEHQDKTTFEQDDNIDIDDDIDSHY